MQNKNKLTDDRLVAAYAQGDNEAFDILLRRHRNRVFSYIYSIVKNRDIANDIFQETFVKAITTIRQGKYAETGKFFAWISRIAHNLIIDHYRQNKSESLVSVDDCESDILNRRDLADTNIEDSLVYEQINDDLHRLIDELPENQQEVLRMRYFKDMSFKEIADATNVSINTALGRMRYALINLRRIAAENEIALTV
ncbi:MAG: sigma-70 family RNA polymerase sigma factor [Paramuribaculum sp.]|nr:sigma-70 family RNA polymerase sigma factor [Paramuribaculum sp.]MDE6303796.1 sigma-70 family RNA polymerase sigma factor [Paramuribaculum sp.]